jgi:hypothetical protein
VKLFGEFIMTEKLCEPPALVNELAQVFDDDIADSGALELFNERC